MSRNFLFLSIFFLFFMIHAWVAILLLGLLQPVHTHADSFSMEAVLEQFSKDLWYVGKGLTPGDSFSYVVCDLKYRFLAQLNPCYHMRLDFYMELESQGRNIWVVQAEISDGENESSIHRHIFLMDSETLEITTDHIGTDYAISMERTITYLARFAHEQTPKSLMVGETWGSVPSALNVGSDLVVISKETTDDLGDVYILEFGLFESNTFVISKDLAFPVSAIVYGAHYAGIDPPVLFTFEMLDHTLGHNDALDSQDTSETIPDSSNGTRVISGFVNPWG